MFSCDNKENKERNYAKTQKKIKNLLKDMIYAFKNMTYRHTEKEK